jgi:hypothetical protein
MVDVLFLNSLIHTYIHTSMIDPYLCAVQVIRPSIKYVIDIYTHVSIVTFSQCVYIEGPLPTSSSSSHDKATMMECTDEDMDALGDALSNLTVKVPASISFGRGGRGRGCKGGARGT